MNTIRNALELRLIDHGLWPKEAAAIMDRVALAPEQQAMRERWYDDASGYPTMVLAVLWLGVLTQALAWIDEHAPQHFARTLLEA